MSTTGRVQLDASPWAGSRYVDELAFSVALGRAAGALVMERYERVERVTHKGAKDVVTEVDHLVEELILGAIRGRYPDDAILAEESGAHDGGSAGERTWIVDPIDGTINFANGIPVFCVSIGLAVGGRPTVGVIVDPTRDEVFAAGLDTPARLNERVIGASDADRLDDCVVSLALGGRAAVRRARAIRRAIRVTRSMGSSALALAYVAAGRFDGFIQSGGMSAWDVAAAGLIAERAGAVVTDMTGGPWFDLARPSRAFGITAAPPRHHAALLELAREPDPTSPARPAATD